MGKTHSSHPEHELELKNYQKPYICDGCNERGFGKRYRCEECDYDLHEDCMFNKTNRSHNQIRTNMGKTHSSHPEHELELKNYQKPYICDGCKERGFGKRYRCEECDYDLHEDCMFNKTNRSHNQIRTNMGKTHSSHPEHELELKNYQKPYICDGCKERGFGKRYRCEECNYDLHEDCMFNKSTTTHKFFKESTFKFKFYDKPPRKCDKISCNKCKTYCNACGKHIKGFVYHCDEKDWDLHPCCHNLKNELKIDGVKFQLGETVSKCTWCNQKKIKDSLSRIKGWSYVSECDTYHFHVYCVMEMVDEAWRNGTANSNDCLALEKLELPIQRQLNRNGGRGNKYWRIAKVFLKTIVSILLGDPTITLGSLLVDLIIG